MFYQYKICSGVTMSFLFIPLQASQKGIIGLAMDTSWQVPKYQTVSCKKAAVRALDFYFGWLVS